MTDDEDDKPTVVLDLNALKKQKLKEEEDLSLLGSELEFSVHSATMPEADKKKTVITEERKVKSSFPVILFDFQTDFFHREIQLLPTEFDYHLVKDLQGLNKFLGQKKFQVVVLNYDAYPKAVNQLTAQIRQKFPHAKTMIIAKSISPEKAKAHAKTASGADGYYQLPLEASRLRNELLKICTKK
jgi:CheY-like chemotaxis protein